MAHDTKAKINRAAFSREDVPDAKRGSPDFELRDYAAARGLEFLDHATPAGFRAALPGDAELQSNVLRGTLPGGAFGVLAHEGLQLGFSTDTPDWDGAFYGLRVIAKAGWKSLIPIVGGSATTTLRMPCTLVATWVPETAGTQTCLRLDTRRSTTPYTFGNRVKLDELLGEKGWSAFGNPAPEPEALERLLADPVADLLRAHTDDGLFQVVVWYGTLLIRRNGYLRSPQELDELCRVAGLLAGRLREVYGPMAEPQRFDAPLPEPAWGGLEAPYGLRIETEWRSWARETAGRLGLALEDPLAYHRAFPSLPVPGIACAVIRGRLPRLDTQGRLVVHRDCAAARPAVVLPAPAGAEATPAGGRVVPEHKLRIELAGGLLAAWSTDSYWGSAMAGDVEAFCASAAAALA